MWFPSNFIATRLIKALAFLLGKIFLILIAYDSDSILSYRKGEIPCGFS
jgi:hypothetical protein